MKTSVLVGVVIGLAVAVIVLGVLLLARPPAQPPTAPPPTAGAESWVLWQRTVLGRGLYAEPLNDWKPQRTLGGKAPCVQVLTNLYGGKASGDRTAWTGETEIELDLDGSGQSRQYACWPVGVNSR